MYARELRKWSLKYQMSYLWLSAIVTMLLIVVFCPNATSMHLPANISTRNTAPRIPSTDSINYNWWWPDSISISPSNNNTRISSKHTNNNSNSNSSNSSNLSNSISNTNNNFNSYNPLAVFSDFRNYNARASAPVNAAETDATDIATTATATSTTTYTTTTTSSTISNNTTKSASNNNINHNYHHVPNVPNSNSHSNFNSYANSLTRSAYNYSNSRSNKLRRHTVKQPNSNYEHEYHSPVRVATNLSPASPPDAHMLLSRPLPSLRSSIETFNLSPRSLSSPVSVDSVAQALPLSVAEDKRNRRRFLLRQQQTARSRRDSSTSIAPLRYLGNSASALTSLTGNYNYQQQQHHHQHQHQHHQQQQQQQQQQQRPRKAHNSKNNYHHHHNNRKRSRRYCSARDPAQLAFEAPTVFGGKITSMTSDRRANFSATFQVIDVFKRQIDYRLQEYVRLEFAYRNWSAECDIYREYLRPRGLVRNEELEQGRLYVMFVKQIDERNFTILGQPIRMTRRVIEAVKRAVSENYAQPASIKSITATNRTMDIGKELRIVCKVQGQPPPKVTWFKGDKSINRDRKLYEFRHLKKRSELIIRSFNTSYAGRYECRAKNKVLRKLDRRAITIKAYPTTRIETSSQQSGVKCPEKANEFCFNGGTCKFFPEITSYSCICPEGFEGERCESRKVIIKTPIPTYKTGYIADDPNAYNPHLHLSEDESPENDDEDDDDDNIFSHSPSKLPINLYATKLN